MNTAKLLLELGNFSSQNINVNIEDNKSKTDDELIAELHTLLKDMPNLNPKLQFAEDKECLNDNKNEIVLKDTENKLSH